MSQASLQRPHLFGGCALLGRVDTGRAAFAQQRVVHVADRFHPQPVQPWIESIEIDAFDGGQCPADRFDRVVVLVQEARAQSRRHADAAVVGGAAADADHQMGNSQIQRRRDQFSRAEGGGEHGVESIPGQQR